MPLSLHFISYFLLIVLGIIASFIAWSKGIKKYLILSILLICTAIVEAGVQILVRKRIEFTFLYHIFSFIEYPLLCLFLLEAIKAATAKKIVLISIPVFIIASVSLSFFYYHFTGFPGMNINLEGMVQCVVCTYVLFNLDVEEDIPILRNQYFWICSGILIFFGTTFFFNGLMAHVFSFDTNKALMLFSIINKPLNLILYAFILIGILCSITTKRLSTQ